MDWHPGLAYVFASEGDSLEDLPIASAAAKVTGERAPDLLFGRSLVLGQQGCRRHQHAGRTETALRGTYRRHAPLQRMEPRPNSQAFDGQDRTPAGLEGQV